MDPTVEDLHSNPKKKGQCLKITEKVAFNNASEPVKNVKIQKFKSDILSNFQTMCQSRAYVGQMSN